MTAFSGSALLASDGDDLQPRANFFAGSTESRGGVHLAVKDLDGDDRADLVAGPGDASGARVTQYAGKAIPADGTPPEFRALDLFPGFENGVFVG